MAKMSEKNLDDLEKRLVVLEDRIFGESNKEASYPKDNASEEPILDTLGRINSQVNTAVAGRPKIQNLMKRLDQLEAVLEPSQMEKLMLSQEAKTEIILAEEELIKKLAGDFEKVKDMADVLGSEHIKAVPSLQGKLQELSTLHLKQQDETMALSDEVKELLLHYNNAVTLLSKQFVHWDEMLTRMEIAAQPKVEQS